MQCARCARQLAAGEQVCPSCGLPVAAAVPAQVSAARAGETGFVLQEFVAPLNTSSKPLTGTPAPFPPQFAGTPGRPAPAPFPYPQAPAPAGQVGYYPAPGVPPAGYTPFPAPAAPVKKRRGLSTGWIILYVFLGLALLFTGVGIAGAQLGSSIGGSMQASNNQARSAAMQLYQQVTSAPPTVQNLFAASTLKNWNTADLSTYGCEVSNAGLHLYIQDTSRFIYCPYDVTDLADIAFQVQMQITAGDAGGLIFRTAPSADQSTYLYYYFAVTRQGLYRVYLHADSKVKQLVLLDSGVTQAMNSTLGATNTLTVIAKGKVFDLYINRQFVLQFQNATLATGSIGVTAGDMGNSTDVYYTNAELWKLSN